MTTSASNDESRKAAKSHRNILISPLAGKAAGGQAEGSSGGGLNDALLRLGGPDRGCEPHIVQPIT